jgi:superfamily II DNA or RNA helicase
MMLYQIAKLGRTTLVIVPKSDLVKQWKDEILKHTDLPEHMIGEARQKKCQYEGKGIVIGMIHSVCKDKYPEEFKNYFGLVIFDELHKLGAFNFSRVGGMFPAKYRIGATATLKRSDGLERVFYSHLGRSVVRPEKSEQPVPKVGVYYYTHTSGSIPSWIKGKINRRGVLFTLLSKNDHRTGKIASFADELVRSGRQTLVLSERIPQLEDIRNVLLGKYGMEDSKVGMYLGKTSDKEKKRVANECTCILATKGMMDIGTNIPTLRGFILATPLSGVAQPIGRIRRVKEGLKEPFVVDVVDSFYPEAVGWFRKRRKYYEYKQCSVNYISR